MRKLLATLMVLGAMSSTVAAQSACPAGEPNVRAYFEGHPFYCTWFDEDMGFCRPAITIPEYPNESFYVRTTGSKGLGQYDIWTREICGNDQPTCGPWWRWKHAICNCVDEFDSACRVSSYAPPWGF